MIISSASTLTREVPFFSLPMADFSHTHRILFKSNILLRTNEMAHAGMHKLTPARIGINNKASEDLHA